jgi:hypothetical protein
MKYLITTILLLMAVLAGCSGENEPLLETPLPFGTVPIATAEATEVPSLPEATEVPSLPEATNTPLPEPANKEQPTPSTPPAPTRESSTNGRFIGLRFASSSDGEAQTNFSLETQEVYALWEYEGMEASDSVKRMWYLNEQLYVEKSEAWDMATYGPSGTVRDVFLYDYIDGIDAGQWRIEIYLNDVQEMVGTFTVQ